MVCAFLGERNLVVPIRNHSWGVFSMNSMLKTGALSAMALAFSSILHPAHAAIEDPNMPAAGSTAEVPAPEATDPAVDAPIAGAAPVARA